MVRPLSYCAALSLLAALAPMSAAADGSGTLSAAQPSASYRGGPYVIPNFTPQVAAETGGEPACMPDTALCDLYRLTVDLGSDFRSQYAGESLEVEVSWDNSLADYDVYLYKGACLEGVGGADCTRVTAGPGTTNPEFLSVGLEHLENGVYTLAVVPFTPLAAAFDARFAISGAVAGINDAEPRATGTASLGGPRFQVFTPPAPFTTYNADEPTLAAVPREGGPDTVLSSYNTKTLRTVFDDSTSPPTTTWADVTDTVNKVLNTTTDPILHGNDHRMPGVPTRVWTSELAQSNLVIAFTDDAGESWEFSTGVMPPVAVDHQAVAAGPYPAGFPIPHPLYPHAVYYCSQAVVNAFCSRSDDGGRTWGPSVAIYPVAGLCGLHGHVKVGADGTVYVPIKSCAGGTEGLAVSADAGQTWTYARIPDARTGRWDPSVAIANDGKTLYVGYAEEGRDRPKVIKGILNKSNPLQPTIDWDPRGAVDVGAPAGLNNAVFHAVVAGDPDRAAYAFLGTTAKGDSGNPTAMRNAVWHLYVATTYDGGGHWELRQVLPEDPVQKGSICDGGIGCGSSPPHRNLLDFMDAVIDGQGRILVSFADGCIGPCVLPNGPPTYSDRGGLARQSGGKPLYARFDNEPFAKLGPPHRPQLSGTRTLRNVELRWPAPESGGSPITGYKVYRQNATGAETVFTIGPKPYFVDATVGPDVYTYRVTALNDLGESLASAALPLAAPADAKAQGEAESACTPPGITVVVDGTNDPLTGPGDAMQPFEDIEWIAVSEPGATEGAAANSLVFALKVRGLPNPLPPQYRWVTYFLSEDGGTEWFVAMTTADTPVPQFTYGRADYIDGPVTVGEFDTSGRLTGHLEDGTIFITLDKDLVGGYAVDSYVQNIYAKVRRSSPDSIGAYGLTIDDTGLGFYQVVGNEACAEKKAAVVHATPSRFSGTAPMTVSFDTTGTRDMSGKGIARYELDCGDGVVSVPAKSAGLQCHFDRPGVYRTYVRAITNAGERSYNTAKLTFLVGSDQDDDGAMNERGYSIFSGAMAPLLLLPLGLALAWRRRRMPG